MQYDFGCLFGLLLHAFVGKVLRLYFKVVGLSCGQSLCAVDVHVVIEVGSRKLKDIDV